MSQLRTPQLHDFGFPLMHRVVTPGKTGEASIDIFEVSDEDSRHTVLGALFSSDLHAAVPPGKYARLRVGGKLMMTDTQMERQSNHWFLRHANGRVLVAGLGLGMILHPVLKKREVTHVDVIEKSADVVKLIAPTLPRSRKLHIITADVFEWKPDDGVLYDTIYFDIWPERSTDNLPEITKLHRRFARKLNRQNPSCWMDSWMASELRYYRDRDRRSNYW